MIESSSAVFLSYASQDAAAAARICEALRAAGIEVWFDQSELRGGDAWDASIRKQIKACALFMPIISVNTHAREEGYFRLEWKLAVDRSHLMAGTKAFVVPVVIDDTRDDDERTPEKFREVQWTRLPGGETPPAFGERVRALLGNKEPGAKTQVGAGSAPTVLPRRASGRWRIAVGVSVLVVLLGGWQAWRMMQPKAASSVAVTATAAAQAEFTPPPHSIAVLPLVDMSEKKDQEYFSDGLSEELIDHLSHIADLKVIARTSSFAFKGKNEDMRSIAAKLGVANLLEGSVRKAGTELRITAQLIRASDGVHLWSETYERQLKDIFKVQDEISTTVAKALNAVLMARDVQTNNRGPDVTAYDLFLQGNALFERHTKQATEQAIDRYKKAIERDGHYALAWAMMAQAYLDEAIEAWKPIAEANAKARVATERALQIDPNELWAHNARVMILMRVDWNWAAAQAEIEHMREIAPVDAAALRAPLTEFLTIRGRNDEALNIAYRYVARDPLNVIALDDLVSSQFDAERFEECAATLHKLIELSPTYAGAHARLGLAQLYLDKKAQAFAESHNETDEDWKLWASAMVYWAMDRRSESDVALRAYTEKHAGDDAYGIALIHAYRHELDEAFQWLDRAYDLHDAQMPYLKGVLWVRNLRGDPRFNALLRKMKLPET